MHILGWIVLSTIGISLLSLVGVFTLSMSEARVKRMLLVLIGFAAGTLIGGAMLHLLPEAVEEGNPDTVFLVAITGFILFFVLEKILWRHCHERTCTIHTFAYLNLVGDGVHNLIDGLIIAASFLVDLRLGFATTLAVAAHEIPQEIGDFGVLVYGGLARRRALGYNLLTALMAVGGGIVGYVALPMMGGLMSLLVPFAAGGFLYIAASDLIPELHKEPDPHKTISSFFSFLAGIVVMWGLKFILV